MSYRAYLFAIYCIGCKTPFDAGAHYMGCCRDSAKNMYAMIHAALAFAEFEHGQTIRFPDGTFEFDAKKAAVKRAAGDNDSITHCG